MNYLLDTSNEWQLNVLLELHFLDTGLIVITYSLLYPLTGNSVTRILVYIVSQLCDKKTKCMHNCIVSPFNVKLSYTYNCTSSQPII